MYKICSVQSYHLLCLISTPSVSSFSIPLHNARTPAQWDDSPQAGVTTGMPWIAVNLNYVEINAKGMTIKPYEAFVLCRKIS